MARRQSRAELQKEGQSVAQRILPPFRALSDQKIRYLLEFLRVGDECLASHSREPISATERAPGHASASARRRNQAVHVVWNLFHWRPTPVTQRCESRPIPLIHREHD